MLGDISYDEATLKFEDKKKFKFKFIKSSKKITYNEHRLQIAS